MDAEVRCPNAQFLRVDARLLGQLFPAIAYLLDATLAFGVRRAAAGDLQHLLEQVVVVEHRDLGDLPQALRTEAHHPGISSENDRDVAVERS